MQVVHGMSEQFGSLSEYAVGKKTIPFGAEEQEPPCNIETQFKTKKRNEIQAGSHRDSRVGHCASDLLTQALVRIYIIE
jgi:hypothetical protein